MRETVAQEKVNVAMLPVGEPRIELLEPTEADSVIGKFLEKRGEGLHHVALKVPDLERGGRKASRIGRAVAERAARRRGRTSYTYSCIRRPPAACCWN